MLTTEYVDVTDASDQSEDQAFVDPVRLCVRFFDRRPDRRRPSVSRSST
jgi:hypothetical protein